MSSQPASMAEAARSGATPLHRGLPEEIFIWEILVRLPPKALLRCHAVCRAWRRATTARDFLLAHEGCQPNLPIISVGRNILAFDHRAAAAAPEDDQLHTVTRLDEVLYVQASCEGLLVLARNGMFDSRFSICNLATRQQAPLGRTRPTGDLKITGMYQHRPTGEYRLLLHRCTQRRWMLADLLPEGQIGCYIFTLGSGQPPRYIGWPETAPPCFDPPALLHDNLHWYPSQYQAETKPVLAFDTVAETFRQMRGPVAPSSSHIFEMDGTLGIYNRHSATMIVDIWVLENYESEVWDLKYRIQLPVAEIRGRFEGSDGYWAMNAVSRDGAVLLLVSFGQWLIHIDSDGKLVDSFHRGGQALCLSGFRLKQTLVPYSFFAALEGYTVNASPFV